jgi:hypothetical protein
LLGHKEDAVAKKTAEELSGKLRRTVVVAAGIRRDALTGKDIKIVAELCSRLIERITAAIGRGDSGGQTHE